MIVRMTIAALMLAGAATPALAQQSVRDACMPDIKKFCSAQMAAMDRDGVRTCLRANMANASPECQSAMKAAAAAEAAEQAGQTPPAASKPN